MLNMDKQSKNTRTLDMYTRLCEGRIVNKAEEALYFGVDERSIQRDIDDIKAFLAERAATVSDTRKVEYSRSKKGYVMTGNESALMDNSEILAVSKILLESRAFTKKEISAILDKMINGCVPHENMKLVAQLIRNEKYHYVELHNKSHIKDRLWNLGEEISKSNLLEIDYQRQVNVVSRVKRIIQPVALLFSEYYFYLNAYIVELDEKGVYRRKYSYPAVFRVDRIMEYKEIGEKLSIEYADRFEEGEFRKRIQFMYAGELVKVQFVYKGNSVESILDRLPTARVLSNEEHCAVIEAEVYGKGVLMWLLSQGKMVEVLKPESFREEMKNTLIEMLKQYQ